MVADMMSKIFPFVNCPPFDHQNPQGQAPALLALAQNARRPLEELPPLQKLQPKGIRRSRVPSALPTMKADSLVALRVVLGI